jgi:hypothetical protein
MKLDVFLSLRNIACAVSIAALAVVPFSSSSSYARQEGKKPPAGEQKKEEQKREDGKLPNAKDIEKVRKKQENTPQLSPVEALLEVVIFYYGGREQLRKVRAAIQEEGNLRLATDQGEITGTYVQRAMMKEKSWLDLMRTDLNLSPPDAAQRQGAAPSIKYTIAYNGASVWSAQNNQYVTPRPDAAAAYRAQLTHDYLALLRYKEDGSKIELKDPETVVGVQTNVVDLTTPDGEKTRYWISKSSLRIIHLEYELNFAEGQPPVKYKVSFFYTPLRIVQNTLVPSRRMMYQDGKFAQEMTVTSVIYSAKLNPEVFQHLQGESQ